MLIGRRIRFLRTHRGMTQKELGKAIGYSDKTADVRVAQYETNTYGPKDKVIESLAKALNVDEADLKVPDILTNDVFMHTMFMLEDTFGIYMNPDSEDITFTFEDNSINNPIANDLKEWKKKAIQLKNGEITYEDYMEWKLRFPISAEEETHEELKNLREKRKTDNE